MYWNTRRFEALSDISDPTLEEAHQMLTSSQKKPKSKKDKKAAASNNQEACQTPALVTIVEVQRATRDTYILPGSDTYIPKGAVVRWKRSAEASGHSIVEYQGEEWTVADSDTAYVHNTDRPLEQLLESVDPWAFTLDERMRVHRHICEQVRKGWLEDLQVCVCVCVYACLRHILHLLKANFVCMCACVFVYDMY